MANQEHLALLEQGIEAVNKWQQAHPLLQLDLNHADLEDMDLDNVNLRGANLSYTNLTGANLRGADLRETHCPVANFSHADLRDADLRNAFLFEVNFLGTRISGANFQSAKTGGAIFTGIDLRNVTGLDEVVHVSSSEIGISTLYLSEGQIPNEFLRGCGVPDEFITQILALVTTMQPIQFYSCFISYSSKDEEFARRLHERMRAARLRVWFAHADIKGGQKLHEQIDRAIQVHDRLLLVLSQESMQSEWVMTEIRKARKAEVKEGRRKLFPIRLVDYDALREWECFDADQGKDLAVEVREYFIPDFSNWKSHDDFEAAFARLLADLKAGA